ncbi:hypothetical protein U9M48_010525, partial [Paspalum notatum var. saurae]
MAFLSSMISCRMESTVAWMSWRLRLMPVTLASTVVHVGNRSGTLKPLDRPTPALMAAMNSGAFLRFLPNAALDTMLLVRLWNITLRFTGVHGPAARISSSFSPTSSSLMWRKESTRLGLRISAAQSCRSLRHPVVADDLAGEQLGAGGEVGVVGLEHRACRLLGRRHHERGLAEPQHHERAVRCGQVPQRAVRQHVHQVVHAADHRQLPRARRQPRPRPQRQLHELKQRDGGQREEERLVQVLVHGC